VGANVLDFWLMEAALILNCKMGRLDFVYLELVIDVWLKE